MGPTTTAHHQLSVAPSPLADLSPHRVHGPVCFTSHDVSHHSRGLRQSLSCSGCPELAASVGYSRTPKWTSSIQTLTEGQESRGKRGFYL